MPAHSKNSENRKIQISFVESHKHQVIMVSGTLIFKVQLYNYRLMQVKSIAEFSKGVILQYFRLSLSYQLSLRPLFCLFIVAVLHRFYCIVNSTTKSLGKMRKLKNSISINAFNQMYISYLIPVVEYAPVVWDGCPEQDTKTLQKLQNKSTQLITELSRSVSLENLYKECERAILSQNTQQNKLSLMYNVILAWCLLTYTI